MVFSTSKIIHKKANGLEYLQFKAFNDTRLVKHCITTRRGGVSKENYFGLNLGINTEDNIENVNANRRAILEQLKIHNNFVISPNQVHEDNIVYIKTVDEDVTKVDGVITNVPGITLITQFADCVPLLFLDPVKKAIGNTHAGWKGTVKKIGQKTVLKMREAFKSNPKDIKVVIGPSIGACCFQTGDEVATEFEKNFANFDKLHKRKGSKYYIDLWEANKSQLIEAGILEKNIICSNICTMCNTDYFFSHRAEKGITGRMGAIISLI